MRRQFRFADLFAGLGGFHLAARRLGGRCVFACEIDEGLRDLYKRNFGILPVGDIRGVDASAIPPHDLLCAGFPCQPFSKAGSQLGLRDSARGRLLSQITAILARYRPEMVVLENVAHFVRHNDGNTYRKLKAQLDSLGYSVQTKQLSPHQFRIPQIRERMYTVARLHSLEGFEWPKPVTDASDLSLPDVLDRNPTDATRLSPKVTKCLELWDEFLTLFPRSTKLPSFPIWTMEFGATYPYSRKNLRTYPIRELHRFRGSHGRRLVGDTHKALEAYLPSHARGSGDVFPHWKKLFITQNREFYDQHKAKIDRWLPKILEFPPSLQKLEWNCQGEERDIWKYVIQFRASGVRVKRPTTAPSLVSMTTTQVPIIAWEKRYMTPRECARLQSMDTLENLPTGAVAAVSALGNAVNVTVVSLILSRLLAIGSSPRRLCQAAD